VVETADEPSIWEAMHCLRHCWLPPACFCHSQGCSIWSFTEDLVPCCTLSYQRAGSWHTNLCCCTEKVSLGMNVIIVIVIISCCSLPEQCGCSSSNKKFYTAFTELFLRPIVCGCRIP
jgi:hypothetical protein